MKVATFNANSLRARLDPVVSWLAKNQPDVLCVQETKVQDPHFPIDAFAETGYRVQFRGMKAYNGVAVFTKEAPEQVSFGLADGPEPDEFRMAHIVTGGIHIINTYIPQGYMIDSPKYQYKLEWFRRLRAYFDSRLKVGDPVLWCGDMNVAPEAIDVHHPEDHENHPCYHKDARAGYHHVKSWGFTDVFRHHHPTTQQFTFFDYRFPKSVESNRGWRIDHILVTPPLLKTCVRVGVDMEPRLQPKSSDHTFFWAEFDV